MSRRPGRVLVALVLAALPLAGCATVPTSGPVRAGSDLRLPRPDPEPVPVIGQHPVPGASPDDIVSGFLQSSADFRDDHAVAREYLTARARQRWRPQARTVISGAVTPDPVVPTGTGGTVKVEISEVGQIDAEGTFRRSPAGTSSPREFRVEKVRGEWRIAGLEDGLVLSANDVLDTYQQVSLYFLAPSGSTLVPDLVLIPELPGITTKLVARLLRGPTAATRDSVVTAFPQNTALEVNSVPVRGGVATVRLDSTALAADDQAREQMSAQIVWTLKQLPDVQTVRITAGGQNLIATGVPENQDRTAWATYDPDQLPASPSAYVVRDGAVGRYLNQKFEPVPGPAGTGDTPLRTPAVSLDASRLAAVSTDGRTVYVGPVTGAGGFAPRVQVRGADFSQPSWDPGDNLWVVDRATGVLWYLADGANRPQAVGMPRFAGDRKVTSVAVARDGAQLALVVGAGRAARLVVAGVRRTGADVEGGETISVVAVRTPLPDLRDVRDVAWADAVTLAVLGAEDATPSNPFYTDTDGYDVTAVVPLPGAVSITAAPPLQPQENPLVAGTADGRLQQFTSGSGWQLIGVGSDPAYPG